jgi:hypothetical protein
MSRAADLLRAHAEVMKLARLLGRDPARLAYLERLPPDDLRLLRDGVTEALYDAHGGALGRLAAASRVLPASLTATIGQRAFGPLLSARLAGMLETNKAVEVAAKLPPPFLADVAVELDPRRASDLIAKIAPALIGQVTAELLARLPKGRSASIIRAAAHEDLWLEALDLLNHLSRRQRRDMVTATLALDEPALQAILDTIIDHDLWDEVLLIAEHDETIQERLGRRLAALPARRRREVAQRARDAGALERLPALDQALSGYGV